MQVKEIKCAAGRPGGAHLNFLQTHETR